MKENIKIGLMALIAATLIINTINQSGGNGGNADEAMTADEAVSSITSGLNPDGQNNLIQENNPMVPDLPKTEISFAETEYDFGKVKQESENKHVFKFTNTGAEPLLISNAVGSCGCTVPNYPKEPIAPGESGEIEVVYSPGKQMNQQSKTVTITANTTPETNILKIKANVLVTEGANTEG